MPGTPAAWTALDRPAVRSGIEVCQSFPANAKLPGGPDLLVSPQPGLHRGPWRGGWPGAAVLAEGRPLFHAGVFRLPAGPAAGFGSPVAGADFQVHGHPPWVSLAVSFAYNYVRGTWENAG